MSWNVTTEQGLLIPLDIAMQCEPECADIARKEWNNGDNIAPDILSAWLENMFEVNLMIELRWDRFGDEITEGKELFDPGVLYVAIFWRPGDDAKMKQVVEGLDDLGVPEKYWEVKQWAFGG